MFRVRVLGCAGIAAAVTFVAAADVSRTGSWYGSATGAGAPAVQAGYVAQVSDAEARLLLPFASTNSRGYRGGGEATATTAPIVAATATTPPTRPPTLTVVPTRPPPTLRPTAAPSPTHRPGYPGPHP
jgi:hypothetical protein